MNALATLRRNRTRRYARRTRAAFWREAGAWAGVAALAIITVPGVVVLASAIGLSL